MTLLMLSMPVRSTCQMNRRICWHSGWGSQYTVCCSDYFLSRSHWTAHTFHALKLRVPKIKLTFENRYASRPTIVNTRQGLAIHAQAPAKFRACESYTFVYLHVSGRIHESILLHQPLVAQPMLANHEGRELDLFITGTGERFGQALPASLTPTILHL